MKLFCAACLLCFLNLPILADVLGQTAEYDLDPDPARTTSMIKSGTATVVIAKHINDPVTGPQYQVDLNYVFNLGMMGKQKGTESRNIDDFYFTPEFIEQLRKTGHFESPLFKADHKGYEDTTTLEGKTYPNCDLVLVYDLKEPADSETHTHIDNLQILVHWYPGIPALSGAKIDISGAYSGMDLKAGGDFVSTRSLLE